MQGSKRLIRQSVSGLYDEEFPGIGPFCAVEKVKAVGAYAGRHMTTLPAPRDRRPSGERKQKDSLGGHVNIRLALLILKSLRRQAGLRGGYSMVVPLDSVGRFREPQAATVARWTCRGLPKNSSSWPGDTCGC